MFGHHQVNCHADYRCMKCASNHSTHLCDKPRTTPAICANCGGEHTSVSLNCKENPNNKNKVNKEIPKTVENPWKTVENHSNTIPKPTLTQQKPIVSQTNNQTHHNTVVQDNVATAIGKLFLSFTSLKPTQEQQIQFFTETNNLVNLLRKK